jgi:hypothetical protein
MMRLLVRRLRHALAVWGGLAHTRGACSAPSYTRNVGDTQHVRVFCVRTTVRG